ncbi:MAG: hypothetical protein JXQ96_17315 [Cyclobacteriaceae bacterium]
MYNKDVDQLILGTLLLLPVFNYLNHSSVKKPHFFPVPLFLATGATYFLLLWDVQATILLPIFAIVFINGLHSIRSYTHNLVGGLYSSADDFFDEPGTPPYEIIKKFKSRMKYYKPSEMTCFVRKDNELNIIAGSRRVATFIIKERDQFWSLLKNKGVFEYSGIMINNETPEHGVVVGVEYSEQQYIYYFENVSGWNFIADAYYASIIRPALTKTTKILDLEFLIRNQKRQMLHTVKKNYSYVDNAVKAVHFLYNKIGPINGYFWMHEKLDSLGANESDKRQRIEELLEKDRKKASSQLKLIVDRTNSILDKSFNPIVASSPEEYSIYHILYSIRMTWYQNGFDHDLMIVNWTQDQIKNTLVSIDSDIFNYVIDEIIININKHKKDRCAVSFEFVDDSPVVTFKNNIKTEDLSAIKKLVEDYNKPGINEIMKRDSHGITFIKGGLAQLSCVSKMEINDEVLNLILTFKTRTE